MHINCLNLKYMLIRSGSRKQMPLQGRKIENRVTLNYNKNLTRLNQNLKLLISDQPQPQQQVLRRKTLNTTSQRHFKNKQNLNTLNIIKQKRRKASPPSKAQSKSLKKLISKSDIHCRTYSKLPARKKSPNSSSNKKAKSLSKQKPNTKHSKSVGRKSLSPQRSYRMDKQTKSKPVSAYTSRETKSSCGVTSRPVKVQAQTERGYREERSGDSPAGLGMMQPIKRRSVKRAMVEGRPMLVDEESISMAKELQKMLEKTIKTSTKHPKVVTFKKPSPKPKPKPSTVPTHHNKSKKVILSQQTSKTRQIFSKQQPLQDQLLSHRYRQSYEPRKSKKRPPKIKHPPIHDQLSMKTEYSVPTLNVIENLAATRIQKVWRGYQTRKQIETYKKVMMAVVTIQRFWRGYLARKRFRKMQVNSNLPKLFDQSLLTVKDFNEEEQGKWDDGQEEDMEERKVSEASDHSQSHSNSNSNLSEQPMRQNIRKMLDTIDSNPSRKLFSSPNQKKSHSNSLDLPLRQRPSQPLIQSPTHILETLPNLQKLHRQKLQHFSKLQKQALHRLVEQKLCSPRTLEFKTKQIDQRLQYEIERFESGVREVMRGWNLTNDEGFMTPDGSAKGMGEVHTEENKKLIKAFKNTFDDVQQLEPLDDISVELSQYPEEEKSVDLQIMKFDSSLMFIEPYLAGLFNYLQSQTEWKQQFLEVMKTPRNISITLLLKNLACVTEESDQDNNFKLPMYKYLKYDVLHIISEQMLQDFHRQYKPLIRHTNPTASTLQQTHLRVIIDVLNHQLSRQRPTKKLLSFDLLQFTAKIHPSLTKKPSLSTQDLLLHNYFAYALEQVFKTASFLCGFIEDSKEIEEGYLTAVNQCRMTQMINAEIVREDAENLRFQEEEIETRVALAEEVFLWVMEEAAEDVWTAYV